MSRASTAPKPNEMTIVWDWYSYPLLDVSVILCFMISIAGIFGNAVVVLVVLFNRALWNVSYLYILNLACADFFRMVFAIPYVISLLYYSYPFGAGSCKLFTYMIDVCYLVSIYSLLFVSFIRYQMAVRPGSRTFSFLHSRKWAVIVCLGLWVLMYLLNLEQLTSRKLIRINGVIRGRSNVSHSSTVNLCYEQRSVDAHLASVWLQFLLGYLLPAVPIVFLCYMTVRHLSQQQVQQYIESRNRLRAISLMFLLTSFSILAFVLPSFIYELCHTYRLIVSNEQITVGEIEQHFQAKLITTTLFLLSCALNPIIYNYFCKVFRTSLLQFIKYGGQREPVAGSGGASEQESFSDSGSPAAAGHGTAVAAEMQVLSVSRPDIDDHHDDVGNNGQNGPGSGRRGGLNGRCDDRL